MIFNPSSCIDKNKYFSTISSVAKKMIDKRQSEYQQFVDIYAGNFYYKHVQDSSV